MPIFATQTKKIMKKYGLLLILGIIMLIGCDKSESEGRTDVPDTEKAFLDSVTFGQEALISYQYDAQGRITLLTEGNGYQNSLGYDSVHFSYPDLNTIIAKRSWISKEQNGIYAYMRRNAQSVFYLRNDLILQAVIGQDSRSLLRDSIVFEYDGKQLSKCMRYEKSTLGDEALVETSHFTWSASKNLERIDVLSINESNNYVVSYTYDDALAKAIIPYATLDFVDATLSTEHASTYLTALANMECFGQTPKNEIRSITVHYYNRTYQDFYSKENIDYKFNISFDYQHDVFDHCDALSYKKTGVGGEEYMNNLVFHWNHPTSQR